MGAQLRHPVLHQDIRTGRARDLYVGSASIQGYRERMEDRLLIGMALPRHPDVTLLGVFDGHCGDQAAEFLETHLLSYVDALDDPFDRQALTEAFAQADAEFLALPQRVHGSTCVLAIIRPTSLQTWRVLVANVGDSRAMVIRTTGERVNLTKDHRPSDRLEKARIVAAKGQVLADRVDGSLALSRAFGDWTYKSNMNLPAHAQKVISVPDFEECVVNAQDTLVLYCDGLVERQDDAWVAQQVKQALQTMLSQHQQDPSLAAIDLVLRSINGHSKDNNTVIVALFGPQHGQFFMESQLLPGPFEAYTQTLDLKFNASYRAEVKRFKLTDDEWGRKALQMEQTMTEGKFPYEACQAVWSKW